MFETNKEKIISKCLVVSMLAVRKGKLETKNEIDKVREADEQLDRAIDNLVQEIINEMGKS